MSQAMKDLAAVVTNSASTSTSAASTTVSSPLTGVTTPEDESELGLSLGVSVELRQEEKEDLKKKEKPVRPGLPHALSQYGHDPQYPLDPLSRTYDPSKDSGTIEELLARNKPPKYWREKTEEEEEEKKEWAEKEKLKQKERLEEDKLKLKRLAEEMKGMRFHGKEVGGASGSAKKDRK